MTTPPPADMKIHQAVDKTPLHLLPLDALMPVLNNSLDGRITLDDFAGAARVYEYGSAKYATGNWLKADDDEVVNRYMGAALRHWGHMQRIARERGVPMEQVGDEESGMLDIDHIICGLGMIRGIGMKLEKTCSHDFELYETDEPATVMGGFRSCQGEGQYTWDSLLTEDEEGRTAIDLLLETIVEIRIAAVDVGLIPRDPGPSKLVLMKRAAKVTETDAKISDLVTVVIEASPRPRELRVGARVRVIDTSGYGFDAGTEGEVVHAHGLKPTDGEVVHDRKEYYQVLGDYQGKQLTMWQLPDHLEVLS